MSDLKIQENIVLAPFTTFKIGGAAKFYCEPGSKEELKNATEWAGEQPVKIYIMGGGSNLLINDNGVDGLVIRLKNENITVRSQRLDCGAGASLAKAAHMAKSHSLTGLEWSIGIPNATIGGAVRGNAEAFGIGMENLVETVETYDLNKNTFALLSNKNCQFGYRTSLFKENSRLLVWQVILKLNQALSEDIDNLMAQSLDFRSKHYPRLPSAGSVFKNIPFTELADNKELTEELARRGKIRSDKIGAGLIIDLVGLKGKTIGGAKVSLEHANHIVNTGKATAENVAMLVSLIKQQVRGKYGIFLHEEIEYFGF